MSFVVDRRADDLVADEFRRLSADVVPDAAARLNAVGADFSIREVDGFYNQAWHALYSSLQAGDPPRDRAGFLAEATFRRGVDEFRSINPDGRLETDVLEAVGIQDPVGETADQQRALAAVSEQLRSGSSQRELQPAALRVVYGMPEMDVWDRLGVPLDRLEVVVESAVSEISSALEEFEPGEPCEDKLLLVNRFALGGFDPRSDGYRDAVEHLKGCDGCRRHVLEARTIAAAASPSGQMLVALTGSSNLGPGAPAGPPPGAPRAASPLSARPPKRPRSAGKAVAWLAAAAVLLFGIVTVFGSGGGDQPAAGTAAVSSMSASEKSEAEAAAEKRKARAAKKRRAQLRAKKRRAAARKRAAARRAAAARTRANAQSASPVTTPQVAAPQTTTQQQAPAAPKPQPQPKPSTDPSEEFGN